MVHELHKLGYQRVRIVPGMSPSGCHWRCAVTHAGNTLKVHGAMFRDHERDCAHYTTGQDNEYFGWADARDDTVQQLAARFRERFPEIARLGHGRDWPYAGWYVEMLGFAERGAFPIAYADWLGAPDAGRLPTTGPESDRMPMPPGGEAEVGEPAASIWTWLADDPGRLTG
jgi:hypothetical protein